jgi:hypothetical protein
MSQDDVTELASYIVQLREMKYKLRPESERCENVMLMHLRECGKKSITIGGHRFTARPGSSPRMSPSERRKWREINFGALLGIEQPAYLSVERVPA